MSENSCTIYFHLRKPKNYVAGAAPIYLRITVDGVAKEIVTTMHCDPDRWDANSEKAKGPKEESKIINVFLDTLRVKVHSARLKLMESNSLVTASSIKNFMLGRKENPRMILEIFQKHNDELSALVGQEYAKGTSKRYETSLAHTKQFIQSKYKVSDMEIDRLNYEFVVDYEFFLKSVRRCAHNTTLKYISNFRKIVNNCIRHGWLIRDPFIAFKRKQKEIERVALTKEELDTLANKEIENERIAQVRDIFQFSCFTGLAYIDVQKLKRSEIATGIDEGKWIFIRRKKTDTPSRIPIMPIAQEILDRYALHPASSSKDSVLPVLSNQRMNVYLKEIANICGLNKDLTFHIARHTFATTVTLSNGIPIETVSKMLGHKNLKTTQHYAKIIDRKVSDDMKMIKNKFDHILLNKPKPE